MSFESASPDGPQPETLREVDDVRALRALAHPLRLALLEHLMSFGERTASQCARVVGASPANCSYHLRSLARFGLVERVAAHDGREHPWRSTATGLRFGPRTGPASAATRAAEEALAENQIETSARLARASVEGAEKLSSEWREAAAMQTYALRLSPSELGELVKRLDALIRPYIGLTRADPPDDARVVHVRLDAFPHPDGM